jgi:hypothetical protein
MNPPGKEEGFRVKRIGKKLVFDHRLGERIIDDITAMPPVSGLRCTKL